MPSPAGKRFSPKASTTRVNSQGPRLLARWRGGLRMPGAGRERVHSLLELAEGLCSRRAHDVVDF